MEQALQLVPKLCEREGVRKREKERRVGLVRELEEHGQERGEICNLGCHRMRCDVLQRGLVPVVVTVPLAELDPSTRAPM